jgi:hypothetical protein
VRDGEEGPVEAEVASEVSEGVAEGEEVEVKLRRFVVEDGGGRLENELG